MLNSQAPKTVGEGAGEVRTHFAVCGGGGASNLGAGGDGALRVEGVGRWLGKGWEIWFDLDKFA